MAEEKSGAVIEAELTAKNVLNNALAQQVAAQKNANMYCGRVIGETPTFVVQQLTKQHTVRHDKHDLPRIPKVGEEVRIAYLNKVATFIEAPKHKQERKRTHAITL